MNAIAPAREQFLLPEDTKEVIFAKDQPQYQPLPSMRTPDGRVITQWEPTADELEALMRGQSITIVMHTFNGICRSCGHPQGLTPLQVGVGGMDLR